MSRRYHLLILCVLTCLILAACYRPSENNNSGALGSTFTVGVILSGQPSTYGWSGDPISGTDLTVTSVENHRVFILPYTDSAQTLDDAVKGLVDSGARVIFLSANLPDIETISAIEKQYFTIVFIQNLSTRDDIARLLPGLALAAPDSTRLIANNETTTSKTTNNSNPKTASTFAGLACAIATLVVVLFPLTMIMARRWSRGTPVTSPSLSVMEQLIGHIQGIGGEKPKKKRGGRAGIQHKRLTIEDLAAQKSTDFAARGEPQPVLHRLSTFIAEDQWFDDSFGIENDKTFLGECGVGVAKLPGVDQGRVGGLEVSIFDKYDIRTQTATVICPGLIMDVGLRAKLEKKGPVFKAEPGTEFCLETKKMRLWVHILEMQMILDAVQTPNSAFEHIVIELAVWEL